MTDKEITEIIATKVMGWTKDISGGHWIYMDGDTIERWYATYAFRPLDADRSCMMAWDRVAEEVGAFDSDITTVCCWKTLEDEGKWTARIIKADSNNEAQSTDRRRAMCLCMVKAVS